MSNLTSSAVLAAASEVLERAGYARVPSDLIREWSQQNVRVFEDRFSVVAVLAFSAWAELASSWIDAQGSLVALISRFVPRGEPKAWDGYLVLFAPCAESDDVRDTASLIQRDTSRVRKLVATGENLETIQDVERALLPLLPIRLSESEAVEAETALDALPDLLARHEVSRDAALAVVSAFRDGRPLLESLHLLASTTESHDADYEY
jgi:hypothetical protein